VVHAYNPSTWKQRQEDGCKFKASLDYILARACLKKKKSRMQFFLLCLSFFICKMGLERRVVCVLV
jgi:hypothetical protein